VSDLPKAERWLTWKVPVLLEEEEAPRLLTPRSDPMEHEHPMDLLFETEQEALSALENYDAEEEAREEGWVLCELTLTPIRKAPDES
jgi:hypothetical protein